MVSSIRALGKSFTEDPTSRRLSIYLAAGASLLAAYMGLHILYYTQIQAEGMKRTELSTKAGRIAQLNEVMTMSAVVAAEGGDVSERQNTYAESEREVSRLAKEAAEVNPGSAASRFLMESQEWQVRIGKIERSAMELAKIGQLKQARSLVNGSVYRQQREVRNQAVGLAIAAVTEDGDESVRRQTLVEAGSAGLGVVVLLIVFRLWSDAIREARQRKKAEETARKSEERLLSIIDNSNDIITISDRDSRVQYVSAAVEKVLGRRPDEIVGTVGLADVHPDDVPGVRNKIAAVVEAADSSDSFDCRVRSGTGDWQYLENTAINLLENSAVQGLVTISRDVTDRKAAESALREAKADLEERVENRTAELRELNWELKGKMEEMRRRTEQTRILSDMGDRLQACIDLTEAGQVVADTAQQLFPAESGALSLFKESRNVLVQLTAWGPFPPSQETFTPDSCWALRRGRSHLAPRNSRQHCPHLRSEDDSAMCLPLAAGGETLGVISIAWKTAPNDHEWPSDREKQLAVTMAEHAALALSNLKLRESLEAMSIRDPLTGLYNRRFMEDSVERELLRADRSGDSVGIIMLDLDRFKQVNDRHGHGAGDLVLSRFGEMLRNGCRGDDLACRYGGEEFVVVMPAASRRVTLRRAEEILEKTRALQIEYHEHPLGPIAVSAGVATFPEDGREVDTVLSAADAALYLAKRSGRDRVAVAEVRNDWAA